MKTLLVRKPAIIAAVLSFACITHAQTYQYLLQPGSTITPWSTGVTVALSGTFTWNYVGDFVFQGTDNYQFVLTALNFTSTSCSLTLDSNPVNSGTGSGDFAFDPKVDATGLASSTGMFGGPEGTYTGNPIIPSQLSISDSIYSTSGPTIASVSFTAVLVPEPNASIVLGVGMITMIWFQRRRAIN